MSLANRYSLHVFKRAFKLNHSYEYLRKVKDLILYRNFIFPPLRLQVEISASCNYHCSFCYHGNYTNKREYMKYGDYSRIINQSKPIYIQLSGVGEPLLNPEIEDILLHQSHSKAFVKLTTNAYLMNEKISNAIVNGNVDHVDVSLDTTEPELYKKVRVGGDLHKVIDNVDYLYKYKTQKGAKLTLNAAMIYNQANIENLPMDIMSLDKLPFDTASFGFISDLFDVCQNEKVDNIHYLSSIIDEAVNNAKTLKRSDFVYFLNMLKESSLSTGKSSLPARKRLCMFSIYNPYIMADGTLLPCCIMGMWVMENQNRKSVYGMGNVIENGFLEVWNSDRAKKVRINIIESREKMDFCRECLYDENTLFKILHKSSHIVYRSFRVRKDEE